MIKRMLIDNNVEPFEEIVREIKFRCEGLGEYNIQCCIDFILDYGFDTLKNIEDDCVIWG